ncbi:hypothetical protein [Helicobacter pylori]|uniref:hypothetical protein n=1 Tax=Helicobacter pylori TaxID=210 RepID=UPI00025AC57E|nr:hypothetical protein [Helicobacter pylori]EIE29177.1 Hypothetical protein HP17_01910 [Helicobacter pylori NCTC 11637 = CCUG 17874 = ATCC 43504 = JCM 12093]MBM0602186.1 hypothetical protein [Helicobacter pylori]MBM0609575.1 hypothetical protein [Helicobacter pylori]MBM0618783.1 hypothetical protein [Helicobacter pylori]MBM0626038.1 hypothetical protein [Helicobacter pylori]
MSKKNSVISGLMNFFSEKNERWLLAHRHTRGFVIVAWLFRFKSIAFSILITLLVIWVDIWVYSDVRQFLLDTSSSFIWLLIALLIKWGVIVISARKCYQFSQKMFALIQRKRQIRENLKNRSNYKDTKNTEKLSRIAEEIISKKQEELQSQETPEGKHDGERLSSVTEEIISKKLEELKAKNNKGS